MCSSSAITVLPLLTRSPRNLDPVGADATIYSTCVQYDSPLAHPPFHRSYATDLPRQSPLAASPRGFNSSLPARRVPVVVSSWPLCFSFFPSAFSRDAAVAAAPRQLSKSQAPRPALTFSP